MSTPAYTAGAPMADQRSDRPSKVEPPADVQERVDRALTRMRELAPLRNECWQFFRGNTYVYRTAENQLTQQATAPSSSGRGKPNYRVRTRKPIHMPFFRQEVSYATQRVPAYEINPSNTDPEVQNAARIASKVAQFGYDKWRIKKVTEKVVTSALVADEGYAWPMWDPGVGPSLGFDQKSERELHEGEITIRTFSSGQVGWEPGLDFDDSRWYVVVQALPPEQVKRIAGYLDGELKLDATDRQVIGSGRPSSAKLVLVTEYLERPSDRFKDGRRLCMANGRVISQQLPYPLQDTKGKVLDEPCLHRLTWIVDPDSDQDLGAMRFIMDVVRSYQDAANKQLEWKNLTANPQIITQPGALLSPMTDEPGIQIQVANPDRIAWRPTPPVPAVLSEIQDRCMNELGLLLSQNDIPSQVEAARGIQALLERDQNARASFVGNLAEWHSRLMRHCLTLVALHYTEKRLIKLNGWSGPELIRDFKGAALMDQVDAIVLPGSIEPRTRATIEQKIMNYAQLGWIAPHQAMAAIDGGTAEGLVKSYELDIGRSNRIIQQIFTDPESVLAAESVPMYIPDPITGQPTLQDVPWYMPRRFDNIPVYKAQFEDAMKTERYDQAGPEVQTMLQQVYNALLMQEAQQAAEAAQAQAAQAEEQGMGNAAQPQTKPMPSLPGISGPGGQVDPAAGQQ